MKSTRPLTLPGINIIAFYSTTIFEQAFKNDPNKQFKAMIGSFGFGLVNWLFAFPAFFTIDSVSMQHCTVLSPGLTKK